VNDKLRIDDSATGPKVTSSRGIKGGLWRIALGYILPTPIVVGISVIGVMLDQIVIKGRYDIVLCAKLAATLIFGGLLVGYFFLAPLGLIYTTVIEFGVNRRIKNGYLCIGISTMMGLICGLVLRDLWEWHALSCSIAGFVTGLVLRRHYVTSNTDQIDNQPSEATR